MLPGSKFVVMAMAVVSEGEDSMPLVYYYKEQDF